MSVNVYLREVWTSSQCRHRGLITHFRTWNTGSAVRVRWPGRRRGQRGAGAHRRAASRFRVSGPESRLAATGTFLRSGSRGLITRLCKGRQARGRAGTFLHGLLTTSRQSPRERLLLPRAVWEMGGWFLCVATRARRPSFGRRGVVSFLWVCHTADFEDRPPAPAPRLCLAWDCVRDLRQHRGLGTRALGTW